MDCHVDPRVFAPFSQPGPTLSSVMCCQMTCGLALFSRLRGGSSLTTTPQHQARMKSRILQILLGAQAIMVLAPRIAEAGEIVVPYEYDSYTVVLDHCDGYSAGEILANANHGTPCGPEWPVATPNYSFPQGPPGLGQALSLHPPTDAPERSSTYIRYGGQLLSQENGSLECWIYLESYDFSINQRHYMGECQGNVGGIGVEPDGRLQGTMWYTKFDWFRLDSGATTIPLRVWTHVALTWGSSGARLYINGDLVNSHPNTGSFADWFGVNSVFVIHGNGSAIDELRISNIQRTGFHETLDPGLSIAALGSSIKVSWSQAAGEWVLQSAASLAPSTLWMKVDTRRVLVGDRYEVKLPTTGQAQFFRLDPP